MSLRDNIARFGATLQFKPASPLGTNQPEISVTNQDYKQDLTLQNLLSIGSEFAPDDIIQLRKRARYGDPRWLYSLYDEMMRLGPASQILKAREALKGTQTIWKATPEEADEDENATSPEFKAARLIRDVTEEAWGKWLPDLKTHLGTKHFYGIAAAQVMWKPKAIENRWSKITDIRPIPARRFRLDPQTLRFKFLTNPYSWEGPFVDDLQKEGKLIFVEVGADVEPLDQRGLLFQCLIPWAIEQFTVRWRAKRLQNFGMPPVMVTYPKTDPNNKAVADLLADILSSGTRASLPEGIKAELLSAPGAGSKGGDPYEAAIEWCDRAYDKIILGHSQVSGVQVGAGSRSSSGDAIGLFKDVTNSRAKDLDNDLWQQCFYPYVVREFGQDWADDHCPTTDSSVIERDDAKELAAVALQLFQAGAAGVIAVEDLVERCGIKIAEDGELTLAGNVKGEHPAPAEVDAKAKATGSAPGQEQATVTKEQKAREIAGRAQAALQGLAEGSGGDPNADPQTEDDEKAAKKGEFMSLGDFVQPAREVLRKRKGKRAIMEFYTRKERFSAASLVGGSPKITLTTFGHEHGAPADTDMNLDVRSMNAGHEYPVERTGRDHEVRAALEAHPMTGAIYGGVKSRVSQAISAGKLVGAGDLKFGIGCEHGKHRSVYVAERLKNDLMQDGHDVTIEHRDAETKSGERGIGRVLQFWSENQPRDEHGRFAGGDAAERASSVKEHLKAESYHRAQAEHLQQTAKAFEKAGNSQKALELNVTAAGHSAAADTHSGAVKAWARAQAKGMEGDHLASRIARDASRQAHDTHTRITKEAVTSRQGPAQYEKPASPQHDYGTSARTLEEHEAAAGYHHVSAQSSARLDPTDKHGIGAAHAAAATAHLEAAHQIRTANGTGRARNASEAARTASGAARRADASSYRSRPTVAKAIAGAHEVNRQAFIKKHNLSAEGGEQFYSDSQERDERGRWTAGGASAESNDGRAAENAHGGMAHMDATDYHNKAQEALHEAGHPVEAAAHSRAFEAHENALDTARLYGYGREYEMAKGRAQEASRQAHEITKDAHGATMVHALAAADKELQTIERKDPAAVREVRGHIAQLSQEHDHAKLEAGIAAINSRLYSITDVDRATIEYVRASLRHAVAGTRMPGTRMPGRSGHAKAGAEGGMMFKGIEIVQPKTVQEARARIAARVKAKLKAQAAAAEEKAAHELKKPVEG